MLLPADLSDLADTQGGWRIILRFSGDELALASSRVVSDKPDHLFGSTRFHIRLNNFVFLGPCGLIRFAERSARVAVIFCTCARPLIHAAASMCLVASQKHRGPP